MSPGHSHVIGIPSIGVIGPRRRRPEPKQGSSAGNIASLPVRLHAMSD